MSATIVAKCPGCKKTVRMPADWANKTVRCVHCGMVARAQPTERLLARQSAAQPQTEAHTSQTPPAHPAAQPVPAFTPVHAAPPADAWSAIADDAYGGPNPPAIGSRYRKKGGGWITAVVALGFLLICLVGMAAAIVVFLPKIKQKMNEQADTGKSGQTATGGVGVDESLRGGTSGRLVDPSVTGAFPRRLLGISVNNYIFANPTSYGHDTRGFIKRDFGQTLQKFANKLRVPAGQVYELSDGAQGDKQKPPLKPIIEQTLARFVESSRPQDRVLFILCAHTVEVEKKPYVVPLEGDIDDVKTLIPLEWIMTQLDKCPAQQKLLIADFNRFDKARGRERPNGGKLAKSTEAVLKNPPPGVQVWSACSAGQYSYEFDDYYEFSAAGISGVQGIKGGAFISLFSVAFMQGMGKIQKPDDALPIDYLAKLVNGYMTTLSSELPDPDADDEKNEKNDPKKEDKKDAKDSKKDVKAVPKGKKSLQTPFLAGEMKGEPVAPNPQEPAPPALSIPTPEEVFAKGVMPRDEVRRTMDLFSLPPIKQARSTDSVVRFDQVLPFMLDKMKEYRNDTSPAEIKKKADKYPLRAAVVEAIGKLRALDANEIALPTELRENDRTDASKANFARLQRGPARVLQQLENLQESLAKVTEGRKEEKSKLWQAMLDYVTAQVKARYVYVHEYTSVIGLVRKDVLPDLDKKKGQIGWKLASSERLVSGNDIKEMAKDARKLYTKLAKEHAGTPFEVLAKREKFTALGLQWEIFGEAGKSEPADPMTASTK